MMAAGISLVVWAGWQNLRQRRLALEARQANRVTLIPDNGTASGGAADASPVADSALRGKPAPALNLVDLEGKKVSLRDFQGHPMVINFWATYCSPCKYEMPWLEEFSKKYAAQGFDVVGVTYDTEVGKETISQNVHQLGVTYPILLSDAKAEKDYLSDGAGVLPMSFYVDKAGKVTEVTAGVGSKDELEAMVKETIAAGVK
jgi:thiol-disulfide isomerase/thioredoxin